MSLQVLPDNGRDTFVEVWVPKGGEIEMSIRPPGSKATYEIREGEARIHFDPHPDDPDTPLKVHFGAVYAREVAQGTNGSMVLLAIGSTRRMGQPRDRGPRALNRQPRREVAGDAGLWELSIRNLTHGALTVDAWIERDDAPPDHAGGSRQAYFPDSCCEAVRLGNATPEDTLNGIAALQHERLHVVGAMRADGPLSAYSASGPSRAAIPRTGPDIVAPADASRVLPGLRTMGFVRGAASRINGTSAACAVYVRALAEQLARDPSKPPSADAPAERPPEVTCVTESMPQADPRLGGEEKRRLFPFDVDL
jgi:hypothetical protein